MAQVSFFNPLRLMGMRVTDVAPTPVLEFSSEHGFALLGDTCHSAKRARCTSFACDSQVSVNTSQVDQHLGQTCTTFGDSCFSQPG